MTDQNVNTIVVAMMVSTVGIVAVTLAMRHRRHELKHKERLFAMEKGISPTLEPDGKTPAPWTPRVYLLRGLMWLFTGIALTVMCLGISIVSNRPASADERAYTAQRLRREGASDSEVRQYMHDAAWEKHGLPLGWAFIGLVPAGVGLAYLSFYRVEGRRQDAA